MLNFIPLASAVKPFPKVFKSIDVPVLITKLMCVNSIFSLVISSNVKMTGVTEPFTFSNRLPLLLNSE